VYVAIISSHLLLNLERLMYIIPQISVETKLW
jgi:hypothetical protein